MGMKVGAAGFDGNIGQDRWDDPHHDDIGSNVGEDGCVYDTDGLIQLPVVLMMLMLVMLPILNILMTLIMMMMLMILMIPLTATYTMFLCFSKAAPSSLLIS